MPGFLPENPTADGKPATSETTNESPKHTCDQELLGDHLVILTENVSV
jgi:hypothetical protein